MQIGWSSRSTHDPGCHARSRGQRRGAGPCVCRASGTRQCGETGTSVMPAWLANRGLAAKGRDQRQGNRRRPGNHQTADRRAGPNRGPDSRASARLELVPLRSGYGERTARPAPSATSWDFSKIEAGRLQLEIIKFPFSKTIESVVATPVRAKRRHETGARNSPVVDAEPLLRPDRSEHRDLTEIRPG